MREDRTYDVAVEQQGRAGGPSSSQAAGTPGRPLLASKLAAAPLPPAVLTRPRLLHLLDSGAGGPVTLVTAPAGCGKTLLLSSWVRERAGAAAIAWVSVEPSDSGGRLWSYVLAALSSTGEGLVPATPDEPPDDESLIHVAGTLARRDDPVILVLDDFHRVDDPAVLSGLDFLLRHAGQRLRLVIGSRTDPALPLHRWRLSGELADVRTGDLSFTAAEAAEVLTAHGVSLPVAAVTELHARTEGWPAGLRLAALSLRDHPDPARFVSEFAGDHPAVADYLTQEVLAGLPTDVHDALMRSSIAEQISGDLLDALAGRTDGDRLLQEVARGVGFLTALGTRPASYRWHRMLGELLRAELRRRAPEDVRALHRRAAAWHEAQDLPADALRHSLAAEAWDDATTLLVDHWQDLVPHGQVRAGGLAAAPPPPEAARANPELALAYAADRLDLHDLDTAGSYLQLAARHEHLLPDGRRERFARMSAAFHLARAQLTGDDPNVLCAAERLLALVHPSEPTADGPPADLGARAIGRAALGSARLAAGDLAAAEAELAAAVVDAERAGLSRAALAGTSRLAFVRAARGELREADRTARAALDLPGSRSGSGGVVDRANAYLALAVVAMHRDRPEDAAANLALSSRSGDHGSEPALAALVELTRARLLQDRGELTASYQALLAGRRHLTEQSSPYLTGLFVAAEAELRTARGDVHTAQGLLVALADGGGEPSGPIAVALARAHLRAGDPRDAARAVSGWEDQNRTRWPLPVRLEAGLLDALAARSLGDQRGAAWALERVLELAEPEGFRRVFIRGEPAIRDLLAGHLDSGTAHWPLVSELISVRGDGVVTRDRKGPPAAQGEPLTERELTILRYLQSILSNVEIATELSLSVNTVKTHVRSIYRKLDASRRREAVRRARDLHLL